MPGRLSSRVTLGSAALCPGLCQGEVCGRVWISSSKGTGVSAIPGQIQLQLYSRVVCAGELSAAVCV